MIKINTGSGKWTDEYKKTITKVTKINKKAFQTGSYNIPDICLFCDQTCNPFSKKPDSSLYDVDFLEEETDNHFLHDSCVEKFNSENSIQFIMGEDWCKGVNE